METAYLTCITNGVRIRTGFDSLELAYRAQTRALANGAASAEVSL